MNLHLSQVNSRSPRTQAIERVASSGGGGGEVGGTLLSAVLVAYHFSPKFCLHFDGVCIFFFKASLYINSKDMFVPCSTVLIISCSFKKSFIRKIIIISRPPFPQPPSIEGYTH